MIRRQLPWKSPDSTPEAGSAAFGLQGRALAEISWEAILRGHEWVTKPTCSGAPARYHDGRRPPVDDGALGFWKALRDVWPETREQ
jgi:hypothetical protein